MVPPDMLRLSMAFVMGQLSADFVEKVASQAIARL
jgi:hypothetical protein